MTRRLNRHLLGLAAVASGCGSRATIEIDVGGQRPLFVTARDGDGGWETIMPEVNGTYRVVAADAFRVLAVCTNPDGSVVAQELLSTVGVGATQQLPYACDEAADATASVTGTMQQAGTVYFGRQASSLIGPWSFTFQLPPGTYDWLAAGHGSGGPNDVRVVLRRDEAVAGTMIVPDVDVVTEGVTLEPVPLDVLGIAATDQVSTTVSLSTRGSTAVLWTGVGASPSTAEVLTQAVLRFYDLQRITVTVPVPGGVRTGVIDVHSETPPSQVTLLPVPDVTFGVANVQWARHGGETYGELTSGNMCTQNPCASQAEHVLAMSAWLDATGQSEVMFDEDAPGYVWAIDPATPIYTTFTAVAIDGDVKSYSSRVKGL